MDYNDPAKKILYTTLSPCKSCAKQIINAGIQEVVFETPYRKTDGLDVLTSGGVVFRQFTRHPDGSVHLDQDEES
jgi:deoxycytidylate deaminase